MAPSRTRLAWQLDRTIKVCTLPSVFTEGRHPEFSVKKGAIGESHLHIRGLMFGTRKMPPQSQPTSFALIVMTAR
jgi:hypothetical protein